MITMLFNNEKATFQNFNWPSEKHTAIINGLIIAEIARVQVGTNDYLLLVKIERTTSADTITIIPQLPFT